MDQSFRCLARVLLLAAMLGGSVGLASAEPETDGSDAAPAGAGEVPWRLATVRVDISGEASQLLERAEEALADRQGEEALARLLELRAVYADVPVPVPGDEAGPVPLYWPARRVVDLLFLRLPPAQQQRALDAWDAPARGLDRRARRGSHEALVRLGEEWPVTERGRNALEALGLRDLEAGRFGRAGRRLERWLRVAPHAPRSARARILLALVDARAGLEDEAGLGALLEAYPVEAATPVATAVGRTTPALRARQQRVRLRVAARTYAGEPRTQAKLPSDPVVLWTLDVGDARVLTDFRRTGVPVRTTSGAAIDGDEFILHDVTGVVRCLDLHTGLERWRFPVEEDGGWDRDPLLRYDEHDLPLRTVTVAGDLVLVVMGAPAATGTFNHRGAEVRAAEGPAEHRTRLVALDRATGALRWTTGRADVAHPVLGDVRCGCHSPPLVSGQAVYALFARRRGVSETHLARLDLQTGRPEWVRFLATGASGRAADVTEGDARFDAGHVEAAPWGARPVLSDREICVLPHAGFAAGVDAVSGHVHWLRTLPRLTGGPFAVTEGFSGRNEPIAAAGMWILAPLDSPRLMALEQGTGRWLWSRSSDDDVPFDDWHHVLGVSPHPQGGPWLRLLDVEPGLLALRRPDLPVVRREMLDDYVPPGRPWHTSAGTVVAGASRGDDATGGPGRLRSVLHVVSWDASRLRRGLGADRVELEAGPFPTAGDVLEAQGVWVVIGPRSVGAVSSRARVASWLSSLGEDADPALAAAALALGSRLRPRADAVGRALAAAADAGDAGALEASLAAATALLRAEGVVRGRLSGAELERLASSVLEHAPRRGAEVLADLLEHGALRRRPVGLVDLLDRWTAIGVDGRVSPEPGLTLRADLFAARLLRGLREVAGARSALDARERRHAPLVERALDAPEAELREVIRRAMATSAAARGREHLIARLRAEARLEKAAAVAAELRLDPPPDVPPSRAARHAWVAKWQMEEAVLLARAGYPARARSLLYDLERWSPDRSARLPGGRTVPAALEDLAREGGWRPARGGAEFLDLRPDAGVSETASENAAPPDAESLRGVVVPGRIGPGASLASERLLVARGLGLELWDVVEGRRLAAWDDEGEGWFGGTLQEVAHWLPSGGVLVTSLVAGEPADRASLRAGDWILRWDGREIPSASDFMYLAASSRKGRAIPVQVLRQGVPALRTFTPGSRTVRDGAVVRRDALYADGEGRVLVPGRLGLAWVDPAKATRELLWLWKGPGVLHRADVVGGRAIVSIRRFHERDLLVGVDLREGVEVWRAAVDGSVADVRATGSSIVVSTVEPSRDVVLEAHTGRFVAHTDTITRRTPVRTYALTSVPGHAVVHGRAWCIVPTPKLGYGLRILNCTTGESAFVDLGDGTYEPMIAGDGLVAVTTGVHALQVYAPDPWTGRPAARASHRNAPPGSPSPVEVPLDQESRLLLAGDRLWTIRTGWGRSIDVQLYALDRAALGPAASRTLLPLSAVLRATGRHLLAQGRDEQSYLLDASATMDGLLLTGGSLGDRPARSVFWVGREGALGSWREPRPGDDGVLQIRRHAPTRVGDVLAIPTDDGVRLVPLEPPAPPTVR